MSPEDDGPLPLGSSPAWSAVADDSDPAVVAPAADPPDGDRYVEVGLLGSGGMGRVALAHDRTLERGVALKRLAAGLERSPGIVARFRREAALTAQLEHPSIVPIYDAGVGDAGEPWYAMRRIRGRSLAEAVREAGDLAGRLALLRRFLLACEAVAYAHDAGVVHRDLKPDNIMLGEFGETLVVDWGLARRLDDRTPGDDADVVGGSDSGLTRAGAVVGTPAWMSPEQADGRPADRRSDVWGLGVTLYYLLEGAQPFGEDGALDRIRAGDRRAVSADAPPELVALVDRCTARDPDARYPDASAVAAELARWLDGRRVRAYDYTAWEILGRFVRRWRVPLAVAAVFLVVLAVTVAVSFVRVTRESDRARAALAESEQRLGELEARAALAAAAAYERPEAEAHARAAIARGQAPIGRGVLMRFGVSEAPTVVRDEPAPACLHGRLSPHGRALLCLDGRTTAWFEPPWAAEPRWRAPLPASDAAFFTASGRLGITGHATTRLEVLDAVTGEVLGQGRRSGKGLRSGERHIAFGHSTTVRVWDDEGAEILATDPCPGGAVRAVRLGQRDWLSVLCEREGSGPLTMLSGPPAGPLVAAWEVELPPGHAPPHLVVPSPDGRRLAMANPEGSVWVADAVTGTMAARSQLPIGHVASLAWGPLVVAVGDVGGPLLWDPEGGRIVDRLPRDAGPGAAFAGAELATWGQRWRTWRLPTLPAPRQLTVCPGAGVTAAVPSADGASIAATCGDGSVRFVRVADGAVTSTAAVGAVAKHATYSPDGRTLAVVSASELGVALFDPASGERVGRRGDGTSRRIAWLADDSLFAASYGKPYWIAPAADAPTTLPEMGSARDLGVSPDARHLAAVTVGDTAGVWLLEAGAVARARLAVTDKEAVAADVTADGARLAVASEHAVRLHDAASGAPQWEAPPITARILDLALSPDDRWLAVAASDAVVRVLDATDGRLAAELHGHRERVSYVEFAPHGRWLVSGSWDDTARLWSLEPLGATR